MNIDWQKIKDFFNYPIIPAGKEGDFHFDTWMLILTIFAIVIVTFLLRGIRRFFTRNMEESEKLKFQSIFKYFNYLIYLIVILVILHSYDVDLTAVLTASAAIFVGLGFALQDLFKDIIAGITILVDKSLLVNDVIEVNDKVARVFEIKLRSTRAITRDDKVLILPNHLFLSETIYNFTQNHSKTRESVHVGVAYGSDVRKVEKLLIECAKAEKSILKSPEPFVMFNNFGDSSLDFGIYFFIRDSFTDPRIKSNLRFAIDQAFRDNNITIPFPQRDVHFYQSKPIHLNNDKSGNSSNE
ncbi:mechanosensitive ion channel family protein [Nonlabens marinus]|uniref:Potassium efflux system KefA protein / Small-conductance mechanosensitive channel n=1 Tax=Nonlabens marinus S1-08 TaxID=1454201 RepID=W8VNQ6_9FLAO|nr:mechanosensitive ion channel domain-containing protein [Nonlabens marinus]BAO54015.1 potassium efflux system KefA protein / Small-conductance mechanosensitive channel [Nonlabens marinus S1-08]